MLPQQRWIRLVNSYPISLLFEEMLCHRPDGSGTQVCWACSLSESSRVSGNRDCGSVRWWHSGSAWCKTLLLLRKVASPRPWAILQGGWVMVLELCSGWGKKRLKPCTQYDIFWLSPKANVKSLLTLWNCASQFILRRQKSSPVVGRCQRPRSGSKVSDYKYDMAEQQDREHT